MNSLPEIIIANEHAARAAGPHISGLPQFVTVQIPLSSIVAALKAEGWSVFRAGEAQGWESLTSLAGRCGLRANSLCRTIIQAQKRGSVPGLEIERARPGGKIVRVRAGWEFFSWLAVTKKVRVR